MGDIVYSLQLHILNVIYKAVSTRKQESIHIYCFGAVVELSKCAQIKPKLSALLDTSHTVVS